MVALFHIIPRMIYFASYSAPQRKTVYIDPPLLKTEVTAGERSLVFHEESLKSSLNNHGKKKIMLINTETPNMEKPGPPPVRRHGWPFAE